MNSVIDRTSIVIRGLRGFDMYAKALQCVELIRCLPFGGELKKQVTRAAYSVVLNIAEGAAEEGTANRRRYFRMARASLWETAAAVDLLRLEVGERESLWRAARVLGDLYSILRGSLKRG